MGYRDIEGTHVCAFSGILLRTADIVRGKCPSYTPMPEPTPVPRKWWNPKLADLIRFILAAYFVIAAGVGTIVFVIIAILCIIDYMWVV